MTNFAISSGGIEYYDAKTGGSVNATLDTYTVSNSSKLVVRTDSYACANHSAAWGSVDNITFSGVGGEVSFDPTYVRYVAYTSGSGNSPAFGAAISQGGVSGVFLGCWANWQSEPITPGSAIPSSGFIKIGGVTGGAFSSGVLTGITATCSGADLQCWIEIRSSEGASITVPRVGKISSVEAWFYLDNTTGIAGQVIPCPTTNTVAQVWSGVWIETAPSSGVFEQFVGVGAQIALSSTPTDARGKFVWQTTSGLRLGSDGTNTVGYLPPAGCKVRIPATILTNCIRSSGGGSGPRVLPNATLTTRAKFNTTASGYVDLKTVVVQWAINLTQAFGVQIKSCAINDQLWLSKHGEAVAIEDVIVAPTQAQAQISFVATTCLSGGTVKNSSFARFSLAGAVQISTMSFVKNMTVDGVLCVSLTLRTSASASSWSLSQTTDCKFTNCTIIGGPLNVTVCINTTISNLAYADDLAATTSSNGVSAVAVSGGSVNTLIDGIKTIASISNIHPYIAVVSLVNSSKTKIRNIGTYAAPFNCGSSNATGLGLSTSGNDSVDFKRCFFTNLRTRLFNGSNSDTNIIFENVGGDYADASFVASLNTVVKSCAFTGITTGQAAVYGAHWAGHFTSATAGLLELLCNEPTADTATQCQITSGTPKFNSSGQVLMTIVGQQIVWELPFFALGYTAFANSAPVIMGTNVTYTSGAHWGNHDIEFQIDAGSGYGGTWLALTAANLSAESISASAGFKLKLRSTCATASAANSITNIRINMVTTSSAQSSNLYPLDFITLSLTGLPTGCDIFINDPATGSILYAVDSLAATTFSYAYETPRSVDIGIIKPGYVPYYIRNYSLQSANATLPISLTVDRNYL